MSNILKTADIRNCICRVLYVWFFEFSLGSFGELLKFCDVKILRGYYSTIFSSA